MKRRPDPYRRVRRAIAKADRFHMKGAVREAFIRKARQAVTAAMRTAAALVMLFACEVASAQDAGPVPVASPSPSADGMRVTVLAGGLVSLSSEASASVEPMARIAVDGPVALPGIEPRHLPRVFVQADLGALPGATVDFTKPETFRSLEFHLGLSQRVAEMASGDQRIVTSLYAEAGFCTRLQHDPAPRDQAVRFGSLGVRLDERTSGSYVALGIAADQRLDGAYQPAVVLGGALRLYGAETGSLAGARVMLVVNAILGLGPGYASKAPHDSVIVGVLLGR